MKLSTCYYEINGEILHLKTQSENHIEFVGLLEDSDVQ